MDLTHTTSTAHATPNMNNDNDSDELAPRSPATPTREATSESVDDGVSASEVLSTITRGTSTAENPTVITSTIEESPPKAATPFCITNAFHLTRSRPPPSSASILETTHYPSVLLERPGPYLSVHAGTCHGDDMNEHSHPSATEECVTSWDRIATQGSIHQHPHQGHEQQVPQEDAALSLYPTGSTHYEGVVEAGSSARVDDEDADGRGQEATTAAPATMALRTRASERGLRQSPTVKSSAERTPAVCSSMHDCTGAFKPQRGAGHGMSTEASAKTFGTEGRDDDNLDDQKPHDEHPARLGGVQVATTIITLAARSWPMHDVVDFLRGGAEISSTLLRQSNLHRLADRVEEWGRRLELEYNEPRPRLLCHGRESKYPYELLPRGQMLDGILVCPSVRRLEHDLEHISRRDEMGSLVHWTQTALILTYIDLY